MLYKLGRFLEILGLIIVPVGVSGNLARPDDVTVKTTLLIAGAGVGVFYAGRLLQRAGEPGA